MFGPHDATRRGRAVLAFVAVAALAFATRAGAQTVPAPDQARAHDAFERGSAAFRTGDYGRAATEYAHADALDPNPAALRAALDAVTLADDPVLGTELIERSARAPVDADTRRVLDAARARFAHRTGHVVIRCGTVAACLATIDGAAVDTSRPSTVAIGAHTIAVQSEAGFQPRIVNVAADQTIEVAAAAPPPPPVGTKPPSEPARRGDRAHGGLPPAYFFAALGVTAVVGGVTAWSAVDTKDRHAQFVDAGCGGAPSSTCGGLASSGESAQTRTNVLLAVSGALAVTTATFGALVHWGGAHGDAVAILPAGPGASLRVGF